VLNRAHLTATGILPLLPPVKSPTPISDDLQVTSQYQTYPAIEEHPAPTLIAQPRANAAHVGGVAAWTSGVRGVLVGIALLLVLAGSVIDIIQFVQSLGSDDPVSSLPASSVTTPVEPAFQAAPVVTPPLTAEYTTVEGAPPEHIVVPGATTYTVTRGDVLYGIAVKHGTTVQALLDINQITDPNVIEVGQVLLLPGPTAAR